MPSRSALWPVAFGALKTDRGITRRLLWWAACGSGLLALIYLYRWASLAGRGVFMPIDFYSFYTGAALVRDGLGSRLYDFGLQARYQLGFLGELPLRGFLLPYVSPPHLALLLSPLSFLTPKVALLVWLGIQIGLVGILIQSGFKASSGLLLQERILLLAALTAFPMLTVTIFKGQLSLILLLCVIAWIRALRSRSDFDVAAWLLLGCIKPQLILVPVLLTVMARRWRALAILAAGIILVLVICVLTLGTSCITGFIFAARWIDASYDHRLVYPAYMYNFKGFLTLLLGLRHVALIRALSGAGLIASLLLIVCLWKGSVKTSDPKFNLRLALSLLLGLFFSPHFYYYDSLLLVPVGYLFYMDLAHANANVTRGIFLGAAFVLPPLFLENALIVFAGRGVRWPVILMAAWAVWMYLRMMTERYPKIHCNDLAETSLGELDR